MDFERLWREQHRGGLHYIDNWDLSDDVHLTYAGTGAGFSGRNQMAQYCGLHPSVLHVLNPTQLGRFDNRLTTINIVSSGCLLMEECLLSVFHHETIDWLAPGVIPCKKQVEVPLVFSVQYSPEGRLRTVRVYWDQATVLKQCGAIGHLAKEKHLDEAIQFLPILTSKQLVRLIAPSESNSNPLNPISDATRPACKKTVLDGMKSLMTDLPDAPITPARHRKLPALDSKIFTSASEEKSTPLFRKHAAQDSHIVFDDTVTPVKPVGVKLVDRIFSSSNDTTFQPSIAVNPKRLESHVFSEPEPFKPSIALDTNRLKSHVFDEVSVLPVNLNAAKHLESHVFNDEPATDTRPCVVLARQKYNEAQFSLSDDRIPNAPNMKPMDPNFSSHLSGTGMDPVETENKFKPTIGGLCDHNEGHFKGASFETDTAANNQPSVATNSTQSFAFKSSINFTDDSSTSTQPVVPRSFINQSQVRFDDDAPLPPQRPSLKITNPPRGKSSIIF